MKKIASISIENGQSYVVILASTLLLLVGGGIFTASTGINNLGSIGVWGLIIFMATIVIHELIHGIGFMFMGARPKYGVGFAGILPFAYATSNRRLLLWQMFIVAYLPFIVLSVFFIAIAKIFPEYQSYALIGFLANFAGAAGDIWISFRLVRYAGIEGVYVIDTKNGLDIFSDNPKARKRVLKSNSTNNKSASFVKQWSIFSLVFIILSLLAPIVISLLGYKGSFTLGFEQFYLFKTEVIANNSDAFSFNFLASIITALAATLLMRLPTVVRNKH